MNGSPNSPWISPDHQDLTCEASDTSQGPHYFPLIRESWKHSIPSLKSNVFCSQNVVALNPEFLWVLVEKRPGDGSHPSFTGEETRKGSDLPEVIQIFNLWQWQSPHLAPRLTPTSLNFQVKKCQITINICIRKKCKPTQMSNNRNYLNIL